MCHSTAAKEFGQYCGDQKGFEYGTIGKCMLSKIEQLAEQARLQDSILKQQEEARNNRANNIELVKQKYGWPDSGWHDIASFLFFLPSLFMCAFLCIDIDYGTCLNMSGYIWTYVIFKAGGVGGPNV